MSLLSAVLRAPDSHLLLRSRSMLRKYSRVSARLAQRTKSVRIDLTLFGILQGNAKTNWLMIPLVGAAYFAVYFLLFRFMIRRFNYLTPGREVDGEETRLYTRADYNQKKEARGKEASDETSALILRGLGGRENLKGLDCCATRLRVTVKDGERVSESLLRESGAAGVIRKGDGIQVVYGPQVAVIKSELEDYLKAHPEE